MFEHDHPALETPALAETVDQITGAIPRNQPIPAAAAARIALDAAHRGYEAGYMQALRELRTAAEVADELGISVRGVQKHAERHHLGWQIGRAEQRPARVYTPADIAVMRALGEAGAGRKRPS